MRLRYFSRMPYSYSTYHGQEVFDRGGNWGTAKGTVAVFNLVGRRTVEIQPFDGIPHDFVMYDGWGYVLSLYRDGEHIMFDSYNPGLGDPDNFEKLWNWALENEPNQEKDVIVQL